MKTKILVIEDEEDINALITMNVEALDFSVSPQSGAGK